MRKLIILSVLLTVIGLILSTGKANAVTPGNQLVINSNQQQSEEKVVVYFFWGEGCPHCAAAKPVLEALAQQHPSIELRMYEIYNVEENRTLFEKMAEIYGFQPRYVPTIFIGDQYWEGWSDEIQRDVTLAIETCLSTACVDKGAALTSDGTPTSVESLPAATAASLLAPEALATSDTQGISPENNENILGAPVIIAGLAVAAVILVLVLYLYAFRRKKSQSGSVDNKGKSRRNLK